MNKIHTSSSEIPQKLTMATFNTFGVPRSQPPPLKRYQKMCDWLQESDIDVVNLQEVYTHHQLRFLQKSLDRFPYRSVMPSVAGPKGALVTFSKLPIEREEYVSFFQTTKGVDRSSLPRFSLIKSALKGILISRLPTIPMTVLNVHLTANKDNDWSPENRFHPLHKAQLDTLSATIRTRLDAGEDIAVSGDFNIAQDSTLYDHFVANGGLIDAFEYSSVPTFHGEFLSEGREPHCIDHMLIAGSDTGHRYEVAETSSIFEEKRVMENGGHHYLSDHIGLRAVLLATLSEANFGL